MKRNGIAWFVYIIIGLGVIGLAAQLFSNPGNLLKSLFVTSMIILGILGVIYFFFHRKKASSRSEMRKYRQAVRQSKAKYNNAQFNKQSFIRNQRASKRRNNRRPSHLRVIDGNKSKEKNRTPY